MRFSLPFPFIAADHLIPMARAAEEVGFHSLAKSDAIFYVENLSVPYHGSPDGKRYWAPDTPSVEPFVALAALAASTSRIRLTTNVVKLPIRHPLLVAKQLSSLAVLSNNRVSLGIGLSWVPEEFSFLRVDWKNRAARFEEMIEILRLACGGGGPKFIEYHGSHYDFDRLMISPSPDQPVPLVIGGHSDIQIRRAARLADGWVAGRLTVDELIDAARRLTAYRAEYGRAGEFSITGQVLDLPDATTLGRLTDAGITDLQVLPWLHYGGDPASLNTRIASIYRFADDYLN